MLYREIITVCSEIHTKHINTLCGQNVELLHVKPHSICINQSGFNVELTRKKKKFYDGCSDLSQTYFMSLNDTDSRFIPPAELVLLAIRNWTIGSPRRCE
jgi:hypothetical protein